MSSVKKLISSSVPREFSEQFRLGSLHRVSLQEGVVSVATVPQALPVTSTIPAQCAAASLPHAFLPPWTSSNRPAKHATLYFDNKPTRLQGQARLRSAINNAALTPMSMSLSMLLVQYQLQHHRVLDASSLSSWQGA